MTIHAMEEMAKDNLDILDMEHGIMTGQVARIEKGDRTRTNILSRDMPSMNKLVLASSGASRRVDVF